jgi:hypothetical protein
MPAAVRLVDVQVLETFAELLILYDSLCERACRLGRRVVRARSSMTRRSGECGSAGRVQSA